MRHIIAHIEELAATRAHLIERSNWEATTRGKTCKAVRAGVN